MTNESHYTESHKFGPYTVTFICSTEDQPRAECHVSVAGLRVGSAHLGIGTPETFFCGEQGASRLSTLVNDAFDDAESTLATLRAALAEAAVGVPGRDAVTKFVKGI